MLMNLDLYVIFAKVVESKSFTKAAAELCLEKNTVSHKVSMLEEELGEALLKRSTRSLSLTPAGKGFYCYCRQILDKTHEADSSIQSYCAAPQGLVRVSAPPGIERMLYKDLFAGFIRQYPEIEIEIDVNARIVDLVKECYDFAIRSSNTALKDSSLIAKEILQIRFGIFASPGFLEKHDGVTSHRQLEKLPYIHLSSAQEENGGLYAANNKIFRQAKKKVMINSVDHCITAVKSGLGFGILPIISVKDEIEQGDLIRILPQMHLSTSSLYIVYSCRQWQPAKLKLFLEFMEDWGKCKQKEA